MERLSVGRWSVGWLSTCRWVGGWWVGGAPFGGSVVDRSVEDLSVDRWSVVGGLSVIGGFVIHLFKLPELSRSCSKRIIYIFQLS